MTGGKREEKYAELLIKRYIKKKFGRYMEVC